MKAMKESRYELIIFWDELDQIFVVDVPELPGCMAHGRSKSEAIAHAEAAIDLWIRDGQRGWDSDPGAAWPFNVRLKGAVLPLAGKSGRARATRSIPVSQ
jgi:predicted RNase H-like HicB family nuclease